MSAAVAAAASPASIPAARPHSSGVRPALRLTWNESVVDTAAVPANRHQPAVLLVGADTSLQTALASALRRHGIFVETVSVSALAEAVRVATPDLVVLADDAAVRCGAEALDRLTGSPGGGSAPVAVIDAEPDLDARLSAYRKGAVAVVRRSASVDFMAQQLAELASAAPAFGTSGSGSIGEITLDELLTALGRELSHGVANGEHEARKQPGPVRLVLGAGRPLVALIDDFVGRIRRHVVTAEPLTYELGDAATQPPSFCETAAAVVGLRVLLVDDNVARADVVAQALRQHGVLVVVSGPQPTAELAEQLHQFDPTAIVMEQRLAGPTSSFFERVCQDVRLRWSGLLVVNWDEVWPNASRPLEMAALLRDLAAFAEPERSLLQQLEAGGMVKIRLESIGPARLLRALSQWSRPIRVTLANPRIHIRLDLAQELLVGAKAVTLDPPPGTLEGSSALAAFLLVASGRVRVTAIEAAAAANLMSPLDVAFDLAERESEPIRPSVVTPVAWSATPAATASPSTEADWVEGPLAVSAPAGADAPLVTSGPDPLWRRMSALAARVVAGWQKQTESGPEWLRRGAPLAVVASLSMMALVWVAARLISLPTTDTTARVTLPAASAPHAPEVAPPARSSSSGEPARAANTQPEELVARVPTCDQLVSERGNPFGNSVSAAVTFARRGIVRGDIQAAQLGYCSAARLAPTALAPVVGLTRVLLMQQAGAAAAEWGERASRLAPDDANVLALYGDALARAGRLEQAQSIWLRASGVPTDSPAELARWAERQRARAQQSVREQRFDLAERQFRRVMTVEPADCGALAGIGQALLLRGANREALTWARQAADAVPDCADALVVLGHALASGGDATGAAETLQRAHQLDAAAPGRYYALLRPLRHGRWPTR